MKQFTKAVAAITLTACASGAMADNVTAVNKAHYGKPRQAVEKNVKKTNNVPLTVVNYTFDQFLVSTVQSDGTSDYNMRLYGVEDNPYNIISIDNPCWPVHVDIYTLDGENIFDSDVYANAPEIDINYGAKQTQQNTKVKYHVEIKRK